MAKALQRPPSRYEEHQPGCIRGILSSFAFRHGRSTRGLLAQVASTKDSTTSMILPHLAEICDNDTEEIKVPGADVLKTSVKGIVQEDISIEHNHSDCSVVDLEQTDSKYRNNQLFLKLLQDQSSLPVNHFMNEDKTYNPCPAFIASEAKPAECKSYKPDRCLCRHHNLFHLRSKSPNKDCPSSSKIVILKPLPAQVQNHKTDDICGISLRTHDKKEEIDGNALQFALHAIKKKLRQAMGKQRHGIHPNRNHFYMGEQKDSGQAVVTETCPYVQLEGSNIYNEGKRHLSELLKNEDENSNSMDRQMSISLGRILWFPEYSVSPCSSPVKHSDGILKTSVKNNADTFFHDNSNHLTPSKTDEEVESLHIDSGILFDNIQPFTKDCKVPQAVEIEGETGITPKEEKITATNNTCFESSSDLISEKSLFQCLDDSSSVPFIVPPVPSPTSRKLRLSEHAIDITDRSSPVSILEPLFVDNDISPSSCTTQPVEEEFQHIQSEAASSASDENEESSFEYIESVMLASGLTGDDILLRWVSFCDILDLASFDQVELLSSRPQHDQKLLFDCTNEALQDLCENYFRPLASLSRSKQIFRGVLGEPTDLILKVWEQVESHLFQNPELELDCEGKWMNLELELELMCSEMEEDIFDELVRDTLFSYAFKFEYY